MRKVRVIDADSVSEVELVARRMRQTLMEVLGEHEGRQLYTMDWLRQRVRWHLAGDQCRGQVFLAEEDGVIQGHTIVRVDVDDEGRMIGLFSTTFVDPVARNRGFAMDLLLAGEDWMIQEGLDVAVTYTAVSNLKLRNLFGRRGYALMEAGKGFVKLFKTIGPKSPR